MATLAKRPKPPKAVADVFAQASPSTRAALGEVRALILDTAGTHPEIGPLTETLKWGQPSYLTEKSKSGTTIRLGWDEEGTAISLFVHCQTKVAEQWRTQYAGTLDIIGDRELRLPLSSPLPTDPLAHCIAMALTYHFRKRARP